MKRSEINAALREMEAMIREYRFALPDFCHFTPEDRNVTRNGALTPRDVTLGSHKKVWWTCSLGHEWEASVHSRTQNFRGCPYCTGRNVLPGFNDLAALRPDIAADWDYNLNGKDRPEQVTVCSAKKVWWVCRKGHPSYLMTVFNRSNGRGCPKCRPERIAASKRKKVLCFD